MTNINESRSNIRDVSLPYYCSRRHLKSTTSLLSFNCPKDLPSPQFEKPVDSSNEMKMLSVKSLCEANTSNTSSMLIKENMSRASMPLGNNSSGDFNKNETNNFSQLRVDDNEASNDSILFPCNHKVNSKYNAIASTEELTNLIDNSSNQVFISSLSSPHHSDETNPSISQARSKWIKLRSTVKIANAFAPHYRKKLPLEREDSFLKRFSTRQGGGLAKENGSNLSDIDRQVCIDDNNKQKQLASKKEKEKYKFILGPDNTFMFVWLSILAASILYNLWTCIAREAFTEIFTNHVALWIAADVTCDSIYLLDILIQFRTGFLEHGLIVYDNQKLNQHYMKSKDFYLDVISLTPLDLVQIYTGFHPILRFPRFIKAYRLYRFVYMVETRTIYPNMWRVANLSHVLFLGCHWFAAFYFLISKQENFSTSWGYPQPEGSLNSVTQKYLRSLYWSTLTLTTIGDMPSPETSWEFVFTILSYLIGVFVFATIVGQVGNVITNQNASRQEFERHLDGAKAYMRNHSVPADMQKRVQRWYDYAWNRGRMNGGGGDINSLGLLPDKLKTELALHVNLETLRKVTIFHECEPEFLHDLVLKMKAFIFTPGDLICRKGEVAREMFIIADGLIEVVSESGDILKQMNAGDFFGEIGILNLDGVNKRTADVRSVGYSELFVLSRDDVLGAFKDHPDAERLIKEYGRRRLQELDDHNKKKLNEKKDELKRREAFRKMFSVDGSGRGIDGGRQMSTSDKWLNLTATLLTQAKSKDKFNPLTNSTPCDTTESTTCDSTANSNDNRHNVNKSDAFKGNREIQLGLNKNIDKINEDEENLNNNNNNKLSHLIKHCTCSEYGLNEYNQLNSYLTKRQLSNAVSSSMDEPVFWRSPEKFNAKQRYELNIAQGDDDDICYEDHCNVSGCMDTHNLQHLCCVLSKIVQDFCNKEQISKEINEYELRVKLLEKENERKQELINRLSNELKNLNSKRTDK